MALFRPFEPKSAIYFLWYNQFYFSSSIVSVPGLTFR